MASAAARPRTNQGETIALTAAALSATHPAPLKMVAAKSCQGDVATAHPSTPAASASAPARVTAGRPKRR